MTTVRQVYEAMQAIAPLELAEHWDNPGLLVDCGGQMHRVLAALDITPEVVAEAAAKQCEMIVSHHPVMNIRWHAQQMQTLGMCLEEYWTYLGNS